MSKKTIIAIIATMFMLVGCNGGGSKKTVKTGTAKYYAHSAVSNVEYTCSSFHGVTDSNGSFTFEMDRGCEFFLGKMKLRTVHPDQLTAGSVHETDNTIIRILQAIDKDNNPNNGIAVNVEIIAALEKEGINKLPTSEVEMDVIMAIISANGGEEVSAEQAQDITPVDVDVDLEPQNTNKPPIVDIIPKKIYPKCSIREGVPKTTTSLVVHLTCRGGNQKITSSVVDIDGKRRKRVKVSGYNINDYVGWKNLTPNTDYKVNFIVKAGGKKIIVKPRIITTNDDYIDGGDDEIVVPPKIEFTEELIQENLKNTFTYTDVFYPAYNGSLSTVEVTFLSTTSATLKHSAEGQYSVPIKIVNGILEITWSQGDLKVSLNKETPESWDTTMTREGVTKEVIWRKK